MNILMMIYLSLFYKKNIKAHHHNRWNNNAIIQIRKKKATQSSPPKHAHSIKKITHPILFFKIRNKLSFYIVLYEKNVILWQNSFYLYKYSSGNHINICNQPLLVNWWSTQSNTTTRAFGICFNNGLNT